MVGGGGGVTWFITYRSIPPDRRMWRREYSSSSWTGWGTRWLGTGLLSSPSASDRWRALSPEKRLKQRMRITFYVHVILWNGLNPFWQDVHVHAVTEGLKTKRMEVNLSYFIFSFFYVLRAYFLWVPFCLYSFHWIVFCSIISSTENLKWKKALSIRVKKP